MQQPPTNGNGLSPQPLAYPRTDIVVEPNGISITISFAADISIKKVVDEQTMNSLCEAWIQTRRDLKKELTLIQQINASRND